MVYNIIIKICRNCGVNKMELKPKMTSQELVNKMKNEKGIRFKHISEQDAIIFLSERNNYFRIASYRKNYDKHISGVNIGKYIDLDFAYLSELATIDMHLRLLVIKMCLDIEHCLKVKLLSAITANSTEDGYDIVRVFLKKNHFVLRDIYHKRKSTYVEELIRHYFKFDTISEDSQLDYINGDDINCPVWAFMEIIGFGEFLRFYDFYYSEYPDKNNKITNGTLNAVKSLRNACAHNNCVIYNLRKAGTHPTREVTQFIGNIKTISQEERKTNLKSRPVFEITSLLCLYDKVAFDTIKLHRYKELNTLVNERMLKHKNYFKNQPIICSAYNFLKKTVDFLL
ncbi:Abi family protein [Ruminococcus bromii]|nr:Abi family protein [Ruminococcus bromii]